VEHFGYSSLLGLARAAGRVSSIAEQLFAQEGSPDFEAVLRRLHTAVEVAATFGWKTDDLLGQYASVQAALRDTVVGVHVPWAVAAASLAQIRTAMLEHGEVFTSNYDLIAYWALMHEGNPGNPLKDLFWGDGRTFDELDSEVQDATPVYWLHGGVHLQALPSGVARKRVQDGANLLTTFTADSGAGVVPLMVTEGSGV
jgi:hypothetical protein